MVVHGSMRVEVAVGALCGVVLVVTVSLASGAPAKLVDERQGSSSSNGGGIIDLGRRSIDQHQPNVTSSSPSPGPTNKGGSGSGSSSSSKGNESSVHDNVGHEDSQFGLPDVVQGVKQANWTAWVSRVRDPDNRSYVVAVAMCADLVVIFSGYQFLRLWLFMGGFVTAAGTFFFFSPRVFDFDDVCCGEGTENARAVISVVLGLLAGAMALWILRAGIFLTGSCLGLILSLFIKGFLTRVGVLGVTADIMALVYLVAAAVCGCLALWKERIVVIIATAAVGSFFFCLCLGYYQKCHFTEVLEFVHEKLRNDHNDAHDDVHLDACDDLLLVAWMALSVLGAAFQLGYCSKDENKGDTDASQRHGAAHQPLMLVRTSSSSSARARGRRKKRHRHRARHSPRSAGTSIHSTAAAAAAAAQGGAGGGGAYVRAHKRTGAGHHNVSVFDGLEQRFVDAGDGGAAGHQSSGSSKSRKMRRRASHSALASHGWTAAATGGARGRRLRQLTAKQRRREERLLRTYGPHILISSSSEDFADDDSLLEDWQDTSS